MCPKSQSNTRAKEYQYLFWEMSYDPQELAIIAGGYDHPYTDTSIQNERLIDLKAQLREQYWRLIHDGCTKKQAQVLDLVAAGFSQMEIAAKTHTDQSSVHKSMRGNPNLKTKKMHGGSFRKLRLLSAKDPIIQAIIKEIRELCEEIEG